MQCKLDNIVILGHSGQPLNDIARQSYEPEGLQTSMVVDEEPEPVPLQTMDTMETDVAETIVELDPKPTKVKSNLLDGERRMNILQQTLEWGHLAPTIPGLPRFLPFTTLLSIEFHPILSCLSDTMPAYPFADNDPFVIEPKNVPNIFFAGNQVMNELRNSALDIIFILFF
jgi:DNA polymerase II small subunit/DNA polymerase delta subunit B